jgi:hypothetical protein
MIFLISIHQTTQSVPQPSNNNTPRKTSFLIFLTDDLGFGDVSYQNSLLPIKTTHIDAMAKNPNSIIFTHFHSASVVCSPSRAGMLTARFPDRDCVIGPLTFDGAPASRTPPLRANTPTIAIQALSYQYKTAIFGKWHVSDVYSQPPNQFGFDTFVSPEIGMPSYNPSCYCGDKCATINNQRKCRTSRLATCGWDFRSEVPQHCYDKKITNKCWQGLHAQYPNIGFHNWGCSLTDDTGAQRFVTQNGSVALYLVDLFEKWLKNEVPDNMAFFTLITTVEPHVPYLGSPNVKKCTDLLTGCDSLSAHDLPIATDYYATVHLMDEALGRVRQILRDQNRDENTMLIFSSDNGPEQFVMGGYGSTGGFRGRKRDVFEGGHRVPGIIEWPLAFKSLNNNGGGGGGNLGSGGGGVHPGLTSMLDVVVTISDIMQFQSQMSGNPLYDITLPRDGISLLPLFIKLGAKLPISQIVLNRNNITEWTSSRGNHPLGVCSSEKLGVMSCMDYAFYYSSNNPSDNLKLVVKAIYASNIIEDAETIGLTQNSTNEQPRMKLSTTSSQSLSNNNNKLIHVVSSSAKKTYKPHPSITPNRFQKSLFDLNADPFETNDLSTNPDYKDLYNKLVHDGDVWVKGVLGDRKTRCGI